ncbi:hypothetical protein F5882DRAFT_444653 [Hyaloscypha sp. PMI_1271]|nr:hypothetical protein F5882DRAFT_444653 [Hyaloscypha sp. PMI_1271]
MSLPLAKASRLKPDIRLAQAISEFEADLSSQQKVAFRNYRSQSHDSLPVLKDVMQLTAEIDRQASGSACRRRCVGPRFTNFLQAVQQFAALGDLVVGGSQCLIACGVWALVRLSLLSIVNFSSYFENLSTIIMTIGRSAPRYQAMALLYPRSEILRSSLWEYFIVVVRLCHHLLKITQKSAFGQFVSILSDSDATSFQSELDRWANTIKEESYLLMAKNIEKEFKENVNFRAIVSGDFKSASLRRKTKAKHRVLDRCSTYDHEKIWKQTRKAGNTTLFTQNAAYLHWRDRLDSCALLYTGKLGSGKSVLLANIVDDLNLHVRSKHIPVAYFFCQNECRQSLNARTIFGSLAKQLLLPISDLSTVAELVEDKPDLSLEGVFDLLQKALPSDYKVYIVLDGLDECDSSEKDELLPHLRNLQQVFTLHLCLSFTLAPENTLKTNQFIAATIASIPVENPDIEEFIEAELERRIQSEQLVLDDPRLILEIRSALLKGSQGMFLWVVLQIRCICAMKTDSNIRQAIQGLPRTLSETFSRILHRSDTSEQYQRRILELITVAYRPMTTGELREALGVIPGDAVWKRERLLTDVMSTLTCCGCLLTVDEEELTVRFVHHSVKKFLLQGWKDATNVAFSIEGARRSMCDTIITYLSYGIFETQLSTTVVPQVRVGPVPSTVINSTMGPSSVTRRLALKLLRSRNEPNHDIGPILAECRAHVDASVVEKFQFLSGAEYTRRRRPYTTFEGSEE